MKATENRKRNFVTCTLTDSEMDIIEKLRGDTKRSVFLRERRVEKALEENIKYIYNYRVLIIWTKYYR